MSQIRNIKLNGTKVDSLEFFSFDLLEFDQFIKEANKAFRVIRLPGVQHKIWDVGFSHVYSEHYSFMDEDYNPVTPSTDAFKWAEPRLRICIPESDKCYLLHFEWLNEANNDKVHAVYECARTEAVNLFQKSNYTTR